MKLFTDCKDARCDGAQKMMFMGGCGGMFTSQVSGSLSRLEALVGVEGWGVAGRGASEGGAICGGKIFRGIVYLIV